jgi:hypothetical protein
VMLFSHISLDLLPSLASPAIWCDDNKRHWPLKAIVKTSQLIGPSCSFRLINRLNGGLAIVQGHAL